MSFKFPVQLRGFTAEDFLNASNLSVIWLALSPLLLGEADSLNSQIQLYQGHS